MLKSLLTAVLLVLIAAAPTSQPDSRTAELHRQWLTALAKEPPDANPQSNDPLYRELLDAPDADLVFLSSLDEASQNARELSFQALAKLKTARTFESAMARLKDPRENVRQTAIGLLGAFNSPDRIDTVVTLLCDVLDHQDSSLDHHANMEVQESAARVLGELGQRGAGPSLRRVQSRDGGFLALTASEALAQIGFPDALPRTIEILQGAHEYHFGEPFLDGGDASERLNIHGQLEEMATEVVAEFNRPEAVDELLEEMERVEARHDDWSDRLRDDVEGRLISYTIFEPPAVGAKNFIFDDPIFDYFPDTVEEWKDLWATMRPLVTNDLKFKPGVLRQPRREDYRAEDFTRDPSDIDFRVSVEAPDCHIGDPIRFELRMENQSEKPANIIRPSLTGFGAAPGMAIELLRDGNLILAVHSDSRPEGTWHAPSFEILGPKQELAESVCLQDALNDLIDLPLREGSYEIKVKFDPGKIPGSLRGNGPAGEWIAPPVHFTITEAPRTEVEDELRLIADRAKLKWLRADLESPNSQRRDRAWRAVSQYGDSRLASWVLEFMQSHPDLRIVLPSELRPYERRVPRAGE